MQFERVVSLFGIMSQQREVESLDRRRAFNRQLFADALLFFKALDFVTTGATVLLDQRRTLGFQIRIVHERRVRVRRRRREREEIGGDVARVAVREPEVWHHRHVLNLQLGAVIRAARMQLSVEDIRLAVLAVVFRRQVALLFRTIRRPTFARVVNPAHDVFEV